MKYSYEELYLVGVGSSAGGIEALKGLLSSLSADKPMAYIIVQHLNPQYKSMLADILSRETDMSVIEIYQGLAIEAGKIYVTPANANVTVRGGHFVTAIPEQTIGPKPSIDVLFTSLAQEKGEKAVGVILSGTGSDGTMGLKSIKSGGGITIAQEPKSAKYNGMPISAIDAKAVDRVMLPEEIGLFLLQVLSSEDRERDAIFPSDALDGIFGILNSAFDIDFSVYKSSTIVRRIEKRMASVKSRSLEEYLTYLKNNINEPSLLYNEILIGVTSFYRDSEAFEALANTLKGYLEKHNYPDIRVWSAGCATGEEAYSLTIILSDICESFDRRVDIQVFATDMDEASLSTARAGIYPEIISAAIPARFLEKYFKKKGNVYEVIRPIREKVIFSRHNLLRDPPFLRLDLVCCRNLLIYLESDIQQKTILSFHHSLRAGGVLFLGKSESLGKAALYFSTISSKYKIFKARADIKPQLFDIIIPSGKRVAPKKSDNENKKEISIEDAISKTLFEEFAEKCVVVDENGNLLYVKGELEGIASLPKGSINLNFSKMINDELAVDFRSLLFKAAKNKTEQRGRARVIGHGEKKRSINISIFPLIPPLSGYLTLFEESQVEHISQSKAQKIDDELYKHLQDELDSTKEHLQTVVEELETSNEELQATNEELQSSNEELQATNEELETSNEELQSSNEELQTAYIELKMVYEEQTKQRVMLEDVNKELLRLNNELSTKEHYISALLDAEQAMVVVTRKGEEIIDANQGFFNFFNQYASIEEFKLHHKCICELFEEVSGDDSFLIPGVIQKDGRSWLDTVMGTGLRQKKALIKKEGKPYIFSVHANDLDIVNQKYVVVFSNITDIETQKSIEQELTQKQLEAIHQKERVQILRSTLLGSNDFLNSMGNSWRESLASVMGMVKELEEDAEYAPLDLKRIREFQNGVHSKLKTLVDSVERSKEFFSISKTREYFDLTKIVKEMAELFGRELKGKGVEIKCECGDEKIEFYGLSDEMRFLIYNTLFIYKKYFTLKEGGEIKVSLAQNDGMLFLNISTLDEKCKLQQYLLEFLNINTPQESVNMQTEVTRMRMIRSVVESEFGGNIELKSVNGYTELQISMRIKSF